MKHRGGVRRYRLLGVGPGLLVSLLLGDDVHQRICHVQDEQVDRRGEERRGEEYVRKGWAKGLTLEKFQVSTRCARLSRSITCTRISMLCMDRLQQATQNGMARLSFHGFLSEWDHLLLKSGAWSTQCGIMSIRNYLPCTLIFTRRSSPLLPDNGVWLQEVHTFTTGDIGVHWLISRPIPLGY